MRVVGVVMLTNGRRQVTRITESILNREPPPLSVSGLKLRSIVIIYTKQPSILHINDKIIEVTPRL